MVLVDALSVHGSFCKPDHADSQLRVDQESHYHLCALHLLSPWFKLRMHLQSRICDRERYGSVTVSGCIEHHCLPLVLQSRLRKNHSRINGRASREPKSVQDHIE
jgi:hypothetical protein